MAKIYAPLNPDKVGTFTKIDRKMPLEIRAMLCGGHDCYQNKYESKISKIKKNWNCRTCHHKKKKERGKKI